jgi:transposase
MSGDRVPLTSPPELVAELTPRVRAFVEFLLGQMEANKSRVANPEAELAATKKTPRNSSLPASSEHSHARPASEKPSSGKKPGGQPGHAKHERPLIPTADCQEMVPCQPTHCRDCGHQPAGSDPEPWRHQVWELPRIKPIVTESQRYRWTCGCCGETTCGELPPACPRARPGRNWSPSWRC